MRLALITLATILLAGPAFAGDDTSVTIEFIWGIGGTTTHKGLAIRAGKDNAEVHIAHWFGPRSNTALGVGLTARTEGDNQHNNRDLHVSGTVGLSYVFQTNSVLSNHFQPYLRLAGGIDLELDGDAEIELSYSRYGFAVAEQFGGIGLRFNDRDEPQKLEGNAHKPENPGGDDDCTEDCDGGDDGGDDCTEDCDGGDDGGDDCTEDCDGGDDGDDGNNGHGNDDDGCDESNPGNGDSCGNDADDDGNNGHGNDDDGDDGSNPGNGGHSDDDDDGNNGHGNDEDGCDESNPGNGGGPPSCRD